MRDPVVECSLQLIQLEALAAPTVTPYVSTTQSMQVTGLLSAGHATAPSHLPATQLTQSPADPAPGAAVSFAAGQHMQVSRDVAAACAEYRPRVQSMQSEDASLPVESRYVPGEQDEQKLRPGASLYLPMSHSRQSVLPVVPTYLPISQPMQLVEVFAGLYLPVPQATHGVAGLLSASFWPAPHA